MTNLENSKDGFEETPIALKKAEEIFGELKSKYNDWGMKDEKSGKELLEALKKADNDLESKLTILDKAELKHMQGFVRSHLIFNQFDLIDANGRFACEDEMIKKLIIFDYSNKNYLWH